MFYVLNGQCISPKATSTTKWKIPYISENILNKEGVFVPFMGITETWLKGYISDAQLQVKNYTVYRSDREKRIHGGALLYVHNSYIVPEHGSFGDKYCNCSIVKIDDLNCITAAVYRPPDCPVSSFKTILGKIQSFIDNNSADNEEIYITGDFNLPNVNWETMMIDSSLGTKGTESASALLDFMSDNFLSQIIKQPTRGNNTIDLVLTNHVQYICETKSDDTCLSDHNLVSVVMGYDARRNSNYSHRVKEEEDFCYYNLNLHKADLQSINSELEEIDWEQLHALCPDDDDGTTFAELVRLTTLQICYKNAPLKELPKSDTKPKVSRPRRILYRKKRKLKARIKCIEAINSNAPSLPVLRQKVHLLAYEIQKNIQQEISDKEIKAVESVKKNPKYFFSYAKRFSKLKSNVGPLRSVATSRLQHDPKQMAELLQDQYSAVFSQPDNPQKRSTIDNTGPPENILSTIEFDEEDIIKAIDEIDTDSATSDGDIPARILKACKVPLSRALHLIWKRSFKTGKVPTVYKEQFITPVFKKGNKTDPSNYRPVSLTSHMIKIFERVIRLRLVEHLEGNNLFTNKQHGFRKGRSCLTQLLQHFDYVLNNYLDNSETDVIYLDYAKAFDKVDHTLLLKKVKAYGIQGELYTWIEQFLLNRSQIVVVDGKHSRPMPVISGVPQGTVLGPILFLMYINDLEKYIQDCKISSFADDTRIGRKISTLDDCKLIQDDLDRVIQWSLDNNMELHEDKFELLCYRTPASKILSDALPFMDDVTHYTTPNGTTIEKQALVRDLGVNMSEDFSWSPQINIMVDKANQVAAWVLGVFKNRSKEVMLQLFKSLIRSRVEYCCPLWNPTKIADIQSLESVQRQFTRRILGLKHTNYWDRLKILKISSLQRRRERYTIIHMWKIYQKICPNDMEIQFTENARLGVKVALPSLPKKSTAAAISTYDNSFAVKAGKLWNTLPKEVNCQVTLTSFKVALGKFLDALPDEPPTLGYTAGNHNSIVDWCSQGGGPRMA